jgi:hypothetical protein
MQMIVEILGPDGPRLETPDPLSNVDPTTKNSNPKPNLIIDKEVFDKISVEREIVSKKTRLFWKTRVPGH